MRRLLLVGEEAARVVLAVEVGADVLSDLWGDYVGMVVVVLDDLLVGFEVWRMRTFKETSVQPMGEAE